jgi:DNA-binding response OmpR family regulator
MIGQGRILMVDRDESFAMQVSGLLGNEGCRCDHIRSAAEAASLIQEGQHDIAIVEDLNGDDRLEWIGEILRRHPHLQVILTTDSPALDQAIRAIDLKLHAYLIKPISPDDLLRYVASGLEKRYPYPSYQRVPQFASSFLTAPAVKVMPEKAVLEPNPLSLDSLLDYTIHNISISLQDVKQLAEIASDRATDKAVCHLLECPRLRALTGVLRESVEVLEKTRTSFKSKELADLRKKLDQVIADVVHSEVRSFGKQPPNLPSSQ